MFKVFLSFTFIHQINSIIFNLIHLVNLIFFDFIDLKIPKTRLIQFNTVYFIFSSIFFSNFDLFVSFKDLN